MIAGAPVTISSGSVTIGTFANANAGNSIAVTPNLSALVLNNPNYVILGVSSPLTADITPAQVKLTALNIQGAYASKVYNGLLQTNNSATITGLLEQDSFNITGYATGTNVGTYTDNLVATPLGGTKAANYSIAIANGSLKITPAPLTVSGLSAASKVYDATTAATIIGTPSLIGVIAGAPVTISSGNVTSGTLASPNAGNAIAVTPLLNSLVLSNTNYVLAGTTSLLTATVSKANLPVDFANLPQTLIGVNGQVLNLDAAGNLINGLGVNAGLASNYQLVNSKPSINRQDQLLNIFAPLDQIYSAASARSISYTPLTFKAFMSDAGQQDTADLGDLKKPVSLVILYEKTDDQQELLAMLKSDSVNYTIPNSVISTSEDFVMEKPVYEATLLNGDPLPAWLKVDSETKVLTADNVPLAALPIQIKIRMLVQGKSVKDTILTLTKK